MHAPLQEKPRVDVPGALLSHVSCHHTALDDEKSPSVIRFALAGVELDPLLIVLEVDELADNEKGFENEEEMEKEEVDDPLVADTESELVTDEPIPVEVEPPMEADDEPIPCEEELDAAPAVPASEVAKTDTIDPEPGPHDQASAEQAPMAMKLLGELMRSGLRQVQDAGDLTSGALARVALAGRRPGAAG